MLKYDNKVQSYFLTMSKPTHVHVRIANHLFSKRETGFHSQAKLSAQQVNFGALPYWIKGIHFEFYCLK